MIEMFLYANSSCSNFIARGNNWNKCAKVVALATSLRDKARAILNEVKNCYITWIEVAITFWGEALGSNFLRAIFKLEAETDEDLLRDRACERFVSLHIPNVFLKFESRTRNLSRLCHMVLWGEFWSWKM